MKALIRLYLISTFSLWLINRWIPQGLIITGGNHTFIQGGAALMLANSLVKPIFSLILLPINLLTFGLFRWVTNVLILYLVVKFVGGINIQPFQFPGADIYGFIVPAINFNLWTAWIAIPFIISLVSGTLIWLVKK
jgi:putative membrane protein